MPYKCVIFDFDGTLVDSENSMIFVFNELAKKYNYKQITYDDIERYKSMSIPSILAELNIPYSKFFELLKKGQKIFKEHVEHLDTFDENLKETLKNIEDMCGIVGIISSNSKKNINKFLKTNKIYNLKFVISSPLFSKEIKINRIIKKYKLKPWEVLYVGDEVRDIHSSKKANVDICSVLWGYHSKQILSKEQPTYLVENFSEVIEIIKKQNNIK